MNMSSNDQSSNDSSHNMNRFWIFAFGVTALAGYMFVLRPTASTIEWRDDVQIAMAEAGERRTGLLMWFTADSCMYCRLMNKQVFPDAGVMELVERFVPLRVDVDCQPELANRFRVAGIPAFFVVSSKGTAVSQASGFLNVDDFKTFLQKAGEDVWPSTSLTSSPSR